MIQTLFAGSQSNNFHSTVEHIPPSARHIAHTDPKVLRRSPERHAALNHSGAHYLLYTWSATINTRHVSVKRVPMRAVIA